MTCEHEESLENVGYGFRRLDYFCTRCDKHLRSVPLEAMTDAEKRRVGVLVGMAFR